MMCIVKKYNLELKRYLISNHCVAAIKNMGLVDMCLFSGEGKPTLLGGYGISPQEALSLGKALINTSTIVKPNLDKKEKIKLIRDNILFIFNLLQDVNPEKAKELAKIFDIKKIEIKKSKDNNIGYIG